MRIKVMTFKRNINLSFCFVLVELPVEQMVINYNLNVCVSDEACLNLHPALAAFSVVYVSRPQGGGSLTAV